MREIRLSGSEGGGFECNRFSLPLSKTFRYYIEFPISSFELLVSSFELLVSSFELLVSSFELLVSSFELLVSSF